MSIQWRVCAARASGQDTCVEWPASSSAQAGINARRTNERGEAKGSERTSEGRYSCAGAADVKRRKMDQRAGARARKSEGDAWRRGGRYCYLRFIVITDGTTSLASNPERSYNHPPPTPLPPTPSLVSCILDYPTDPPPSPPSRSRARPRVAPAAV